MLIASRRASLLLSSFLITGAVAAVEASKVGEPEGFWILENRDPEKPYGGLKLNRPNAFSLLVFDSNCQLYKVEGKIRRRAHSWELKNHADHSNVFILTRESQKLRLVDTEGQEMLFTAASEAELEQELKMARSQQCALSTLKSDPNQDPFDV